MLNISPLFVISFGVAITMISFGINQLTKPYKWLDYLPPWLIKMSPLKPETDMRIHSLGNIIFGLYLIFPFYHPLIAAWIAFIWWLTILPFAFRYNWAIGMRDLSIILALLALILLL